MMLKFLHFGLIALDGVEMDYKVFTSNLANLKRLKDSEESLKSQLDLIIYDLGGVKGVHYDSVMVHGNPSVIEEKRLEKYDELEKVEKELEFTKLAIAQIEETLNRMPKTLREMLIEVFVYGKTYRAVGEKYGYSYNGAWHYIKRETERFL